jgi:hypothetical protein
VENRLIDENQYFVESKKAILVVLQNEELLKKQMKPAEKLELVKEYKKKTQSIEEYEKYEKIEKELRFKKTKVPAVPEEHRKTIKKNAVTEELAVNEKLNEMKGELKEKIEYLEAEVLPLVEAINKLEGMKGIPNQIDALLKAEMGEGVPIEVSQLIKVYHFSNNEVQSAKAIRELKEAVKSLEKIEVPVETKGLINFLKRGKK